MRDEMEKINYKEEYYNQLIEEEKSKRFRGWFFLVVLPILTIFVWIFGVAELWSLKDKLILTGITIFFSYGLGYFQIKEANKEIKILKEEAK